MKTVEIGAGESIGIAAHRICNLSKKTKKSVQCEFNGINLIATPTSTAESIVECFFSIRRENRKKLESHPKYIKAQELRRQAEKLEQEANLELNDR